MKKDGGSMQFKSSEYNFAVIQDQHYALGYQKTFVFIIITKPFW